MLKNILDEVLLDLDSSRDEEGEHECEVKATENIESENASKDEEKSKSEGGIGHEGEIGEARYSSGSHIYSSNGRNVSGVVPCLHTPVNWSTTGMLLSSRNQSTFNLTSQALVCHIILS